MKIIIKDLIVALLVVTLIAAFIVAIIEGLHQSERVECFKLQQQSEDYQAFYLTEYEKKMCDFHGIIIHASVQ